MRILVRRILAGSAVLTALALAGCAAAPIPTWTNSPDPVVAPVFASNDEALAAAVTSYEAYGAMSNQITNEGGVNPERITDFVSDAYLAVVLGSFASVQDDGLVGSGSSAFDTVSLVRYDDDSAASASVRVYLCLDVTDVVFTDLGGNVTTPPERRNRIPLEVSLISSPSASTKLVVDKEETWPGNDFCS
ncbi:hypothetical protein [Cryobacterium sp. CG_9.6]|uniref:hypothetical protein n=1 Tax=Cryobacterium sp. CG_9.6 TaxID=2760710 RepID=UPI0024736F1E|nr:hypothetical protein [Cryobacterium sp. CG_9.6]MDH6235969.1 hypothetical protein [Cryobacterium sp. CG_9.6]